MKAFRYGPISNLNPLKESVSEINLPKRSSIVVSALGLNLIISPGKSSESLFVSAFGLNLIISPGKSSESLFFSLCSCFFNSHQTRMVFVLEVPVGPKSIMGILDFIR